MQNVRCYLFWALFAPAYWSRSLYDSLLAQSSKYIDLKVTSATIFPPSLIFLSTLAFDETTTVCYTITVCIAILWTKYLMMVLLRA